MDWNCTTCKSSEWICCEILLNLFQGTFKHIWMIKFWISWETDWKSKYKVKDGDKMGVAACCPLTTDDFPLITIPHRKFWRVFQIYRNYDYKSFLTTCDLRDIWILVFNENGIINMKLLATGCTPILNRNTYFYVLESWNMSNVWHLTK